MLAQLPADVLADILRRLLPCDLCAASATCRALRALAPDAWTHAFVRDYGAHSALWAPILEPVRDAATGSRARVALRLQAAAARRAGRCHHRVLPFRLGDQPSTSPFFISSLCLHGP